jgi:DNA polymerase-3 subunit gamma/tau
LAVSEGQDIDVIEIDAASNTGVDNIRELRSNANYRPARSRFKIYIIDEVHMLSTGAFNALLKTLEEPPDHIKFIMATTEPQKVPATIQSRCLRFDFHTISVDKIAAHFKWILEQEKIQADDAVIRRVAKLGNGSMRDGLSLLDQLLSMGSDALTLEMIDDILPAPHDEVLQELIGKLTDCNPAEALTLFDNCLSSGYSLERFAEALAEQVRTLMLLNICGPDTSLVELPTSARESMVELSKRVEADAYIFMIAVLEELRRNIRFSTLGRALMEAGLVRMANAVPYRSIQSIIDEIGNPDGGTRQAKKKVAPNTVNEPANQVSSNASSKRYDSPPAAGAAPKSSEQTRGKAQGRSFPETRPGNSNNAAPNNGLQEEAAKEPMVREALDLFEGSLLVNVERIRKQSTPESK